MDLIAARAHSVWAAGQIGHEILRKSRDLGAAQVHTKSPGDISTEIDRWAEEALRHALSQLLPQARFLGEESSGGDALTDEPTWIVDPIDGTANFARGYPHWSICIALAINREPVLGVIHDPIRGETFSALQGHGATLHHASGHTPLRCSTRNDLLHSTAATVFPKPHAPFMADYLREFERIITRVGQLRRSGSMALELAYLAAGRIDAFWERGMAPWDAAAGIVILRESGAHIWAMDDLPLLQSRFLAASNRALQSVWTALLKH
jgi:myo-inositol-1(or 4)-monophosphatase